MNHSTHPSFPVFWFPVGTSHFYSTFLCKFCEHFKSQRLLHVDRTFMWLGTIKPCILCFWPPIKNEKNKAKWKSGLPIRVCSKYQLACRSYLSDWNLSWTTGYEQDDACKDASNFVGLFVGLSCRNGNRSKTINFSTRYKCQLQFVFKTAIT